MLYDSTQLHQLLFEYMSTEELKIPCRSQADVSTGDEYAFGFVQQDKIRVTLRARGQRLSGNVLGGDLFLIPPGSACTFDNLSANHTAALVVIRFQCVPKKLHVLPASPLPIFAERLELIRFRIPQVRSWIQDFIGDSGDDAAHYYQLQSHLYGLAAAYMTTIQKPKQPEAELLDYVEQTRQYMVERYNNPFDMEEIARLSGVGSSRFYQAFRRHTGLSPHKYMTKIRLDMSLSLLADSSLPILDVAHSVGYPDEYYFSRLFKKHMGMSPTEYALSARRKIACLAPIFLGDLSVLGITPHLVLERGWWEAPEVGLRKVAEEAPELIFIPPVTDDVHRALSRIAPVVMLDWKRYSWKERLLDISRALDISTVAERWLSYFEVKTENARYLVRKRLGDESVLLVNASGLGFRVFGMQMRKMKDLFYDDLQVTPPALVRNMSFLDVASVQELSELDSDHVVFLVDIADSEDRCAELEHHWRSLNRDRPKKNCFFIRTRQPLMNNAAVHESLVDQMVSHLVQYT